MAKKVNVNKNTVNKSVLTDRTSKRIIDDYSSFEPEKQKFKKLLVERSGFVPRSVLVKKMAVQGELNRLISDYQNNALLSNNDDLNVNIGILNIKGLSRSEMIRLARDRSSELFNKLNSLERNTIDLENTIQGTKSIDDNINPPISSLNDG